MNVLNTSSIHCSQFSVDKPGMSLLMLKVLYTGCSNVLLISYLCVTVHNTPIYRAYSGHNLHVCISH